MSAAEADILILNGLPRHAGQAERLETRVRVRAVVVLEASAEAVLERIRYDTGGDREGRVDDSLGAVRGRIETYRERTLPLIAFYGARGAAVVRVAVGARTTAEDMRLFLADSELLKHTFAVVNEA